MNFDFIIIGSGLAGLTSALVLQDFGSVLVISKSTLSDNASNLAQGGINAVVDPSDSFENHVRDTIVAGAGHNDEKAVSYMVENAPRAIDWLITQGTRFERKDGRLAPTKEAAHSHNRVLHATDFTGQEIERALVAKVRNSPKITVWENCFALELIVKKGICAGVQVMKNSRQSDKVVTSVFARAVILATGGVGQIYQWTTNPRVATGDGVAMAYRAGASVADLEFIQFHPTALRDSSEPLFLLSEALRGEGAQLVKSEIRNPKSDKNGKLIRFMEKYDKRLELAPRDIVARAIFAEQKKGYGVFLDIRHRGREFILKRFPNISRELKKRGFDLVHEVVPVTPAAHYSCGGVVVDLDGKTEVGNLFAFGEVACTGVHGANRLASNSLLEAVVFPLRLREYVGKLIKRGPAPSSLRSSEQVFLEAQSVYPERERRAQKASLPAKLFPLKIWKKKLQKLMWEKVGIVRKREELQEALLTLDKWEKEIEKIAPVTKEITEVRNMVTTGKLIVTAALNRPESLGAHFILT